MAVNVAAEAVVGEKCDGFGNVVRRSEARHGDAVGDVGVAVSAAGLIGGIHFCFHPSGAHGVDPYAAASPL